MSFADAPRSLSGSKKTRESPLEKDLQAISRNLQLIQQNNNLLDRKTFSIDVTYEERGGRKAAHDILQETKEIVQDTEKMLRQYVVALDDTHDEIADEENGLGRYTQPDAQTKKRLKFSAQKLNKQLNEEMQRLSKFAKRVVDKERKNVVNSCRSNAVQDADPERRSLLSAEDEEESDVQDYELQFVDDIAVERAEGIQRIHTQIVQVHEIFKELGTLVVQQGHVLETLDDHVSHAKHHSRRAVEELQKASKSQKTSRSRICCLLLLVAAILLVVLLSVLLTRVLK
eukprot:GILJ01004492.1.p1 GENE.GILJ01004492.1~~GILJ01004492.1.p1  ORF type:complete len:286 (-),score=37.37 GILJ01004492.1:140-997(-)